MSKDASAAPSGSRWSSWGRSAFDKSIKISDWASDYANAASKKAGANAFWPKSNDTIDEIAKCERILRDFTVEGLPAKEEKEQTVPDGKGSWVTKKRKVLKKIPPSAIAKAKGVVIYTSMRTGIAPFGGAGGTGLVMARLPDGSWSAPASVSPNNLSVGLLLGVDIFDVVLLLNTDKALQTFYNHKVSFGAETAIAAGPIGSGTSIESGFKYAPIYSYVKSRGLYAGVEAIGQAFLSRFDENERFYYWPGIKAGDILQGKVKIPPSVYPLHRALRDAETGRAQGGKLERTVYDVVKIPDSEVISHLSTAARDSGEGEEEDLLQDGERLRLPPTPQELDALEKAGIPDEEDLRLEQKEREEVYKLPPPPIHKKVQTYWNQHPNKRALRRTDQLVMGGLWTDPATIPLPSSPQDIPLPPSPSMDDEDDFNLPPAYQTPTATYDEKPKILPPPTRTNGTSATASRRKLPPGLSSREDRDAETPVATNLTEAEADAVMDDAERQTNGNAVPVESGERSSAVENGDLNPASPVSASTTEHSPSSASMSRGSTLSTSGILPPPKRPQRNR